MSSTTRGPQFGDLATYVIMGLQNRKNKEREAQFAQQQVAFNAWRMQSVNHRLMPYNPPVDNFIPINPLRFGGKDQCEGITVEDVNGNRGVGQCAEQTGESLFVAGERGYHTLSSYEKLPPDLEAGRLLLSLAGSGLDQELVSREAEKLFLLTVAKSTSHTHKAIGYRHAAIAAKLAGDDGAAKAYQTDAKKERMAAAGSDSWSQGPQKDIAACLKDTHFILHQTIQSIKNVIAAPLAVLCTLLIWPIANIINRIKPLKGLDISVKQILKGTYNDIRLIASPFEKARIIATENLKLQFKALNGEDSDDEWIFKNSARKTRGTSTNRGLSHKYY